MITDERVDKISRVKGELSSAVLCRIVGKTSKHLGNSYRYIEGYAKSANLTPWQGCMKVMSDTEKVLNLIVDWTNDWLKEGENESGYHSNRTGVKKDHK